MPALMTRMTATPDQPSTPASPTEPASQAAAVSAQAGALDSARLLQGHKAVTITHNGTLYRLQATRLGKLILTK